MLIGFVQGYEELKWGISKINPLCNGPHKILWPSSPEFDTATYGLFLNLTCGIRLSDMRNGGKKDETWLFLKFDMSQWKISDGDIVIFYKWTCDFRTPHQGPQCELRRLK